MSAKNAKDAKETKTIYVLTKELIFFCVLCVLRGQKILFAFISGQLFNFLFHVREQNHIANRRCIRQ